MPERSKYASRCIDCNTFVPAGLAWRVQLGDPPGWVTLCNTHFTARGFKPGEEPPAEAPQAKQEAPESTEAPTPRQEAPAPPSAPQEAAQAQPAPPTPAGALTPFDVRHANPAHPHLSGEGAWYDCGCEITITQSTIRVWVCPQHTVTVESLTPELVVSRQAHRHRDAAPLRKRASPSSAPPSPPAPPSSRGKRRRRGS